MTFEQWYRSPTGAGFFGGNGGAERQAQWVQFGLGYARCMNLGHVNGLNITERTASWATEHVIPRLTRFLFGEFYSELTAMAEHSSWQDAGKELFNLYPVSRGHI